MNTNARPNSKFWEDQANKAAEALVRTDNFHALMTWREKAIPYQPTWKDIAIKSQERLHEIKEHTS